MAATVETISNLERRLTVTLPLAPLQQEINQRIVQLSRTAKLPGFRPGKVPLRMVQQQYGQQVRDEVLTNAVERTFSEAIQQNQLRVVGYPNIEQKPFSEADQQLEYTATFEVIPEVVLGDISKAKVERPVIEVKDADIQKTLDVLVKQRAVYEPVKRAAKKGDRVNISLVASMDGQEVERTGEQGLDIVLNEGGRVPEFDENIIGAKSGTEKAFDISYPADHKPEQLAGKTVSYQLVVNTVFQAKLPAVDVDFAKSLGIEDGDVETMRKEIGESLKQEVSKRVNAKLKEQVFQVLLDSVDLEVLPKAVVAAEVQRLMQGAQQNLQQRGVDLTQVNLEPAMFEAQAMRNAKLKIVLSEVVNKHQLQANAEQIRAMVEVFAKSFEQPDDVIAWYYQDMKRLDEPAALATEENVVQWALEKAQVVDKKLKFDDLMGTAA